MEYKGKAFISEFRKQPPTLGAVGSNGKRMCDNATDSDGGFYLHQASLNGLPPYNCIGFNFSTFNLDGYVFRYMMIFCFLFFIVFFSNWIAFL